MSCGADRAPCSFKTAAPTSSSSAVVIPHRTARTMASRARATTRPASLIPSKSAADSIDISSSTFDYTTPPTPRLPDSPTLTVDFLTVDLRLSTKSRDRRRFSRLRRNRDRPALIAAHADDDHELPFGWGEVHLGGLAGGTSQRVRAARRLFLDVHGIGICVGGSRITCTCIGSHTALR